MLTLVESPDPRLGPDSAVPRRIGVVTESSGKGHDVP